MLAGMRYAGCAEWHAIFNLRFYYSTVRGLGAELFYLVKIIGKRSLQASIESVQRAIS